MFLLATLVLINECKAQWNCIHNPTFRHSTPEYFIMGDLKSQHTTFLQPWANVICQPDGYILNFFLQISAVKACLLISLYFTLLGNILSNHALKRDDSAYLPQKYIHLVGRWHHPMGMYEEATLGRESSCKLTGFCVHLLKPTQQAKTWLILYLVAMSS